MHATRSWRAAVGLLVLGGMAVLGAGSEALTTSPRLRQPPLRLAPRTPKPFPSHRCLRQRCRLPRRRWFRRPPRRPQDYDCYDRQGQQDHHHGPNLGDLPSPIFSTSAATGAINIDPSQASEKWWVNNDAWNGSHGPQTLSGCNQSNWHAVSDQPNNAGTVETYPDTEYDVGGRKLSRASPSASSTRSHRPSPRRTRQQVRGTPHTTCG